MTDFGTEVDATCWRNGCQGVIAARPVENCTCHIAPPCSACTEPREYCPGCDWQARDEDDVINGFAVKYADRKEGVIASWKPVALDPRKIDYRVRSHTHFSQICEGVYPMPTSRDDVEQRVRGTFGGRFEHFGDGKFKYIAYTD